MLKDNTEAPVSRVRRAVERLVLCQQSNEEQTFSNLARASSELPVERLGDHMRRTRQMSPDRALVRLYEAWDRSDQAAEWQAVSDSLGEANAPDAPSLD